MHIGRQISIISLGLVMGSCALDVANDGTGVGLIRFNVSIESIGDAPTDLPVALTLSTADSLYSHTWPNIKDFPDFETYPVGRYVASAVAGIPGQEGRGCPCYEATAEFEVTEGSRTNVPLNCTLTQAIIIPEFISTEADGYILSDLMLHTPGHGYISAEGSDEPIFLTPGATVTYLTIADSEGKSVRVSPDFTVHTEAASTYPLTMAMTGDNLVLTSSGQEYTYSINPLLFSSEGPTIVCKGFSDQETLHIPEGQKITDPLQMVVSAPGGIKTLKMTMIYQFPDMPQRYAEFDLLDPDCPLVKGGLTVDMASKDNAVVDMTQLVENFGVTDTVDVTMQLVASDELGRISEAVKLTLDITSVDFKIVNTTPAVIGVNAASIRFLPDVEIYDLNDIALTILDGNEEKALKIKEITNNDDHSVTVKFDVPPGLDLPVITVYYLQNPKLNVEIVRTVPHFTAYFDVYATYSYCHITSETPAMISAIVEYAKVTDNSGAVRVAYRDKDEGYLIITDLAPHTTYSVDISVLPNDYEFHTVITTENALEVPGYDFEDVDVDIKYPGLESGGKYSSTVFPIYNQQNTVDIEVFWPKKYWASVNAKTFCTTADVHNTWYMLPSAETDRNASASGSKSIKISSVGWDVHGAPLQPSVQDEDAEYAAYNTIVPEVAHRSAGRLFLGKYTFNPTSLKETYEQGYAFTSRPISFNGYYKYTPDQTVVSDKGQLLLQLVNDSGGARVLVASAEMEFDASPNFRTFNIPITYYVRDVKPTNLLIMFASSVYAGDIGSEDINVPVTANPSKGAYLGSSLWIDNLSFTY